MTPQGQGKGLLPIWTAYQRGFGVRRISLALATRSGPDVAAMPSALPVPRSGTVKCSFGAQDETPAWSQVISHKPPDQSSCRS